jgi:hypothetical protein
VFEYNYGKEGKEELVYRRRENVWRAAAILDT